MENIKVVLITGASKGIGKACAIEFAKKGYNIVINYITSEKAALELEEYLRTEFKVDVLTFKADVSEEEEVVDLINTTVEKFGRIDILINNAGIVFDVPFENKQVFHWKKTLDVNLIGTFLVSKYASKYMMDNKYGKIINISSTNGLTSFSPFSMDYDASKAAIISLTHNLAVQLQPYVNVNAVAPGWVNTDMNKELPIEFLEEEKEKIYVKYIAEPIEIAKVVVFLTSDDARYINSEVIKVDGGYRA